MKPERIEELLKGTIYTGAKGTGEFYGDIRAHKAVPQHRLTPVCGNEAFVNLLVDSTLNAARVQLLAKALRDIRGLPYTCSRYEFDYTDIAKKALAEAGLLQEAASNA